MDAPDDPTLRDPAPLFARPTTPTMCPSDQQKHEELIGARETASSSPIHEIRATNDTKGTPQCCCGRPECPFLAHSCQLLEGLEKDVQTAARMGQALLVRHEAYMADASRERAELSSTISSLQSVKSTLEAQNAATIAENRALLDQLERLNASAAESDARVQDLTAELRSTREELARALSRAAGLEELERQVTALEMEQEGLIGEVEEVREEEKGAVWRWRQAERTISELNGQIERIEREAREERERHVDIVGRLERRHAVERELTSAAGRLKGAAAAKVAIGGRTEGQSNVVGHFVKDILQDNANLQLGIVELRELLMSTNEEVERLRQQLTHHQPVDEVERSHLPPRHLEDELSQSRSGSPRPQGERSNTELHVHHHYHAPSPPPASTRRDASPAGNKPKIPRRTTRRKRHVITPTHFVPMHSNNSSSDSTVRRPLPSPHQNPHAPNAPTTSAAILSQTTVSVPPQRHANRFSIASAITSTTSSSMPGSPTSTSYRNSSIMDRVFSDAGLDSSRPTSPEDSDIGSPIFGPLRESNKAGLRSISTPAKMMSLGKTTAVTAISTPKVIPDASLDDAFEEPELGISSTIPEEDLEAFETPTPPEDSVEDSRDQPNTDRSPPRDIPFQQNIFSDDTYQPYQTYHPRLQRSTSHESLLSVHGVHGMDVHSLTTTFQPRTFSPSSAAGTGSGAVLGESFAVGSMSGSHGGRGFEALRAARASRRDEQPDRPLRTWASREGLGRKVGGWVLGRWGVGATGSPSGSPISPNEGVNNHDTMGSNPTTPTPKRSSSDQQANASASSESSKTIQRSRTRVTGVNQIGPIWGLGPEPKAPFRATVNSACLDLESLQESLAET